MSHRRPASFDALEPRCLFTFATLDADFGTGGLAAVAVNEPNREAGLTPIADGRIVLAGEDGVRLLRGDGTLDAGRRHGGVITFAPGVQDVAVDPATGRFAVLRKAMPAGGGDAWDLIVDAYDAKGKRVASRVVNADFTGGSYAVDWISTQFGVAVAIAADGSVYVGVPSGPRTSDSVGDAAIEVRRYGAALAPDAGYGTAGVARRVVRAGLAGGPGFSLSNLALDAGGRVYAAYRFVEVSSGRGAGLVESEVVRFTAAGVADAAYGDAGVATFYRGDVNDNYEAPPDDPYVTVLAGFDVHFAADGRGYMLVREDRSPADGSSATSFQLRLVRLDANGARAEANVGREYTYGVSNSESASLAVDAASGAVYVATNLLGPTATIWKYDDGATLAANATWSNWGDSVTTTARQGVAGMGVDREGRLLIGGVGLIAIDGTADVPAALPSGRVHRLADGTILVNGTSKADVVNVRTKKGRLIVSLNGRETSFAGATYQGLVIRAGNGDDSVTLGTAIDAAYVEAGAGDDRVFTTARHSSMTLVGGSGDDELVGADGGDFLYGQAGDDTLYGGDGADELFGGDGADALYASVEPEGDLLPTLDGNWDRLSGGRGGDAVHVDRDVETDYDTDITWFYAWDLVIDGVGDYITGR